MSNLLCPPGIPHQRHYPPHFMEPMHPRQRQLEEYPPALPYQQHIYEPPEVVVTMQGHRELSEMGRARIRRTKCTRKFMRIASAIIIMCTQNPYAHYYSNAKLCMCMRIPEVSHFLLSPQQTGDKIANRNGECQLKIVVGHLSYLPYHR